MNFTIQGSRHGLCSNILHVLTWIAEHPEHRYCIDWNAPQYCRYGARADGNIWDHFFEQLGAPVGSPRITGWPHCHFTGKAVAKLYRDVGQSWRFKLHEAWKRLQHRSSVMEQGIVWTRATRYPLIGLHVRSFGKSCESTTGRMPDCIHYFNAINKLDGNVFLATDNEPAVQYFRQELGSRLFVREIRRAKTDKQDLHMVCSQSPNDASDLLVDVLALASCEILVHGISNVATVAMLINPSMKSIYIEV
jgi:hypothetical protein